MSNRLCTVIDSSFFCGFARYKALVLVAGGIGVSPFIAILRDLLHRHEQKETDLPVDVILVWAVKKRSESYILDLVTPDSLCADFASHIHIDIQVYVTQEAEPDVELSGVRPASVSTFVDAVAASETCMPGLTPASSNLWTGVVIASSVVGYLVLEGIANAFYVWPADQGSNKVVRWWVKGLIALTSLVLGVVLFGGCAILVWYFVSLRPAKKGCNDCDIPERGESKFSSKVEEQCSNGRGGLTQLANFHYGSRPELQGSTCCRPFVVRFS